MEAQPTDPTSPARKKSITGYVLLGGGLVVAALVLALSVHAAASWYLSRATGDDTAACTKLGAKHFVSIENGKAEPTTTHGVLCDTLTIVNKDPRLRLIAFGQHDHHQAYDGVTEQAISEGQGLSITFNKTGEYTFHDHIDDSSVGYFMVTK